MIERPRLRDLEAFPVETDEGEFICLRDPSGLSGATALVPRGLVPLLLLFDGSRDMAEIQADLARRGGLVSRDAIAQVAERLDEALLLDSPRFREHVARVEADYLAAAARPAAHAGASYPADPAELRRFLDEILAGKPSETGAERRDLERAGEKRGATDRRADSRQARREGGLVRAIVAPHIDFERGATVYGWAYATLLDQPPPDLYVVFGTDHVGSGKRFSLTSKPYDTPLGPVAAAPDVVETLTRRVGAQALAGDIAHRAEHSVEFQALLLRRIAELRGDRPPVLLPVLCGSLHDLVESGADPAADPVISSLCAALDEALGGRRALFVAAADLSHVGPRFGDPAPLAPAALEDLARHDAALLAPVCAGDAAAFYRFVAAELDRRRVCGLPPIYTMLRVAHVTGGELLGTIQCPAGEGSWVSVAAVQFRETPPPRRAPRNRPRRRA